MPSADYAPLIAQHLQAARNPEWWEACFLVAIDATGNFQRALKLADQADKVKAGQQKGKAPAAGKKQAAADAVPVEKRHTAAPVERLTPTGKVKLSQVEQSPVERLRAKVLIERLRRRLHPAKEPWQMTRAEFMAAKNRRRA